MAVLLTACCVASGVAESPPNVILIVADDLGYGDLGCYESPKNREVRTPHIDKLANNGIRFTDFHSAGPMCTPTRVSILTGNYQQRFGPVFDGPLSGESQRHLGLPAAAVTIAELLQQKNYATACFGKWHLGFQAPSRPIDQGFDEFRGLLAGDGDHHSHIDRYGNEDWWHNDRIEMEAGYTTDLLTKHSIDFMQRHRDSPFFLYLPHLAIHFPWQGPGDPAHRVKGKDYKADKWGVIPDRSNVRPHVTAMIEAIDRSTGQIVAELKRLNLTENTVIIFTSDNGGYLTYGDDFDNISSNGVLRGQKGTLYEGGHRVPLIVTWEGKIQPAVKHSVTHSNDFLPTICSLAGVNSSAYRSDGTNLAPLLLHGQKIAERDFYWRAGNEWAFRRGAWKLVFEEGKRQLYNLDDDLGETHDLSSQHSRLVAKFNLLWDNWNRQMPRR